jgi:hypothetical protein
MSKAMLTVIVGVFLAAFATELMTRRAQRRRSKSSPTLRELRRAFLDGYHGRIPTADAR